jgi:hypothetical protein
MNASFFWGVATGVGGVWVYKKFVRPMTAKKGA